MKASPLKTALFLGAVALALLTAEAGNPAFPGANGNLAFVKDGDIWVANADGSNAAPLTTHPAGERSPRWSPDGTELAFASNRDGDFEIFVIGADGSNERQVTFNVGEQDRIPSWTSDGAQIVYDKNFAAIHAIDADGSGGERKVADGFVPGTSPHGEKIVFAAPSNDGLVTMRLDGAGERRITDGNDFSANWSPSGNDLVFTRSSGGDRDVYVVHTNGTDPLNLTNTPDRFEFAPVWSPAGDNVAFVAAPAPSQWIAASTSPTATAAARWRSWQG